MTPLPVPPVRPLPFPVLPPVTIAPLATSVTAFLGRAFSLPATPAPQQPTAIASFSDFQQIFGGLCSSLPLTYAVRDFFNNGGTQAIIVHIAPSTANPPLVPADFIGNSAAHTGLYQLDSVPLFNTLCIPPDTFTTDIDPSVWAAAATYCQKRLAMLIVDPPAAWSAALHTGNLAAISTSALTIPAVAAPNVAVYLPRVVEFDPHANHLAPFVPCGAIAGAWATTDALRGVWKAPAGADASLQAVDSLEHPITDAQSAVLTSLSVNPLRALAHGAPVVWGARTLAATAGDPEFQYIPVKRLTLFIEASINTAPRWAASEPMSWVLRFHAVVQQQVQASIGAFLHQLFVKGAFMGVKPEEAYFVRCDATNNTPADINNGVVNILIGFAPLKPAEFVYLQFQQLVGQPPS